MKRIIVLVLVSLLFAGCITKSGGVTREEFQRFKNSTETWVGNISQEINETNSQVKDNSLNIGALAQAVSRLVDVANNMTQVLADHENRIKDLEGQEPPPPPPGDEWKPGIGISLGEDWTWGKVIFEVKGLRNEGNPNNPSQAGKDVLFTACRDETLEFQRTAIELRKYYYMTTAGLVNRIKLKVSKEGFGAVEPYMDPIPNWDPNKLYRVTIEFRDGYTRAQIEVEEMSYSVEASYSWQHAFRLFKIGANPKYSAPPGAEFRLISFEGGK